MTPRLSKPRCGPRRATASNVCPNHTGVKPMKSVVCLLVLVAGSAAVAQPDAHKPAADHAAWVAAADVKYTTEDVVTGVEVPWAIVFDPSGRMLFTERPGRLRVYENGALQKDPYFTVPDVWVRSETGLMGLCLHPDYAKNKLLYMSYGYSDPETKEKDVRVVRFKDTGTTLEEDKVIVSGIAVSGNHSGCPIHFGPDGKLYIGTGEMFRKELAQDMTSLGGKMLRVNDDGTVPNDNPFVGQPDARGEIWALGLRNPQSFGWQPGTDIMFESEHGPSGEKGIGDENRQGDEFNKIVKGANMGWPIIHHDMEKEGLVSPLINWSGKNHMAPGGGAFCTSDAIPEFKGNYFVGCLLGQQLRRISLDGQAVAHDETLIKGLGRIRAVAQGPDGYMYFGTSNKDGRGGVKKGDDRIVRIKPNR